MPRLIIDEVAQQLAAEKLSGAPLYAGRGGELMDPGVIDLVDDGGEHAWQPGGERTRALALGVEACHDMVASATAVLNARSGRRRAIKAMAVPTCNLMDSVNRLHQLLNDQECRDNRNTWPLKDRTTYRESARRLRRTHLRGPVRTARNKLGAHLDPDVYDQPIVLSLDDVMSAFGDCLMVLLLALNHGSKSFSWIRSLGSLPTGEPVVETMFSYPMVVRWVTDAGGNVIDVFGFGRLAADPLNELQEHILSAASMYNNLAELDEATVSRIWVKIGGHVGSLDAAKLAGPLK